MQPDLQCTYDWIEKYLFSHQTNLIYDRIVRGREDDFPTAREIAEGFPNPCGYATGMEDAMLSGGTMLDTCLLLCEREGDTRAAVLARELVRGMLDCAHAAGSEGFLPRAVAPEDGKSHYPDSSRDQYTLFAFGMHRYMRSGLCTDAERAEIAAAAEAIARRCERNVTPQTGYDMLTEDGRPTLVTVMWGDTLGNHEFMRLPMLYLLAYEAGGDPHWLEMYRSLREEACARSLPMGEYWALYTLQQMQASLLVCLEADPDAIWRERWLAIMHTVADHVESLVGDIRRKTAGYGDCNLPLPAFRDLPMREEPRFARLGYPNARHPILPDADAYFALQDGAQAAIVAGLVPGRRPQAAVVALLRDAYSRIDLDRYERNLPVYFLNAFVRSEL